jgi:hypothetical protein
MKSQLYISNLLCGVGGMEYFALVLFQRLNPVANLTCMLRNVGRDSEFCGDKGRCEFGTGPRLAFSVKS